MGSIVARASTMFDCSIVSSLVGLIGYCEVLFKLGFQTCALTQEIEGAGY